MLVTGKELYILCLKGSMERKAWEFREMGRLWWWGVYSVEERIGGWERFLDGLSSEVNSMSQKIQRPREYQVCGNCR